LDKNKTLFENIRDVQKEFKIDYPIVFTNKNQAVLEKMEDILDEDLIYLASTDEPELNHLFNQLKMKDQDPFVKRSNEQKLLEFDGSRLNLSGSVYSIRFSHEDSNLLCTNNLLSFIELYHINTENLTEVDLSSNELSDPDLLYIVNFIQQLPNCHTIDLSHNNFHGSLIEKSEADSHLFELLNMKHVKTVIILGNGMATSDRRDLYLDLQRSKKFNLLKKLIWIPERWIEDKKAGWLEVIKTEQTQNMIKFILILKIK